LSSRIQLHAKQFHNSFDHSSERVSVIKIH